MAVTITRPSGVQNYKAGNRTVAVRDIAFSGNYATGGETITASQAGLSKRIEQVDVHGGIVNANTTTGLGISVAYNSTGSVTIKVYESAASAGPFLEKDNAEAYPASTSARFTFIGV
jgi:hypothetical protein